MAGRRADVTVSAATYSARASAAINARLSAQPFRSPSVPGTLPRVWLILTPKLNLDVHLAWRAVGLMSR